MCLYAHTSLYMWIWSKAPSVNEYAGLIQLAAHMWSCVAEHGMRAPEEKGQNVRVCARERERDAVARGRFCSHTRSLISWIM